MKLNTNSLIFGISIVVASIVLGVSYVSKSKKDGEISVTGLGKKDFTSDLIIWEAEFSTESDELKIAYSKLEAEKKIISDYLISKGIQEKALVFSAVRTLNKTKRIYSNGKYMGEEFDGYSLSQTLLIESNNVEQVEKVSREITELLNKGIQLYSESPRYYYTKLADLKIEMISKATEDARVRAEKISENSGSRLGQLKSAKMGVFQITGQNSKENYSWGGTFNTSSKAKTASITMKLIYQVK